MDASTPIIANLRTLFAKHGQAQYGEHVTQLEHALQCASLAQASDAAPSLILAALLHDIGHFLHHDARAALQAGIDDQHEVFGAEALARWFGPEVWQPVALHVDAKRHLCANDPNYYDRLSAVSKRTLALQGGPFSAAEAEAFRAQPFADEAIALRRWDDAGKTAARPTPPLEHFLALVPPLIRVVEGNTASKTASEMASMGSSEIALVNRVAIGGER